MIELNKDSLFMTFGDKTVSLGEIMSFTEESELDVKKHLTHHCNFYNTASVTFEIDYVDLARLDDFCSIPQPNKNFILEYSIPIMIQAHWHKKPRVRKKWLKRFGMKSDTVKMRANATFREYHADDGSFDFESDMPKCLWRPDQLRRGIKIEW